MRKRTDDGSPVRDHVAALVDRGRLPPEELHGPEIPEEIEYLWTWFREIELARTINQAGLQPLGYLTIDAWARLTDRHLTPFEVQTLLAVDLAIRFPGDD